jgi:hypothetical protein
MFGISGLGIDHHPEVVKGLTTKTHPTTFSLIRLGRTAFL